MARIPAIIFCILAVAAVASAQKFYGTTDLKTFRDGRDKEFRTREDSPLTDADFAKFAGLNYFPNDSQFRVKAQFVRTADEKTFLMPTTSGKTKTYSKYGILKFRAAGKDLQLNVYQSDAAIREQYPEYADLLFIPFRDLTSGKETYGVGRYLTIKTPAGGQVILDFNLAYNPSCAYGSSRYSCPIPPKENFLDAEIKAGEKKFEYTRESAGDGSPK